MVAIEEPGGEGRSRELDVEHRIGLRMVLTLDHRVVQCVADDLLFSLLYRLFVVLVLLLRIGFIVDSNLLLALVQEVLKEVGKLHFDKH